MKSPKNRITHEQFHLLCLWIEDNADDLVDVKYSERAVAAEAALGFTVAESNAKSASELTNCQHQFGRVNTLYFAVLALAHSGGFTMAALARKGREVVRKARLAKKDDGTPDLFADAPEVSDSAPEAGIDEILAEPEDVDPGIDSLEDPESIVDLEQSVPDDGPQENPPEESSDYPQDWSDTPEIP